MGRLHTYNVEFTVMHKEVIQVVAEHSDEAIEEAEDIINSWYKKDKVDIEYQDCEMIPDHLCFDEDRD